MTGLRGIARIRMQVIGAALGLAVCSTSIGAQQATGSGALAPQPSDTIVRLALDSARARGVPFVTLLDEAVYRLESDGRSRLELRQVVQLLDANAARSAAERALAYQGGTQTLTMRWVRVLRLNGEVISDSVAQSQDAEVPVSMSNPIYTGQRVRRLSLAGVGPGVIIDMAYTIEQRTPPRPGDFMARWTLGGPVPLRRSRFVVDVPSSLPVQIVERNLVTRRAEQDTAGRRVYVWSADDQLPLRNEPFASDSNGVVASVLIGPAGTWAPVASWYDALAKSRYTVSPAVAQRADSLLAASGARTRIDTVRALHRWVAQDVRYVSISLGQGGYQPRTPEEVLRTGVGDCKDKATLFIALLRRARIDAEPVLLNITGRPLANVPSVLQFNHAIAAVRIDGQWHFTDLTAELLPFGELPTSYQGAFALQVSVRGDAVPVTLPVASASAQSSTTRLTVRIDGEGRAVGVGEETATGMMAMAMRMAMVSAPDSARRSALTRSMSQRISGGVLGDVTVDSLQAFNGRDLGTTPALRYAVRYDRAWRTVGSSRVLQVPPPLRGPAKQFAAGVQSLEALGTRRLPIDASRVIPPGVTVMEWKATLPPGWTAELPPNARATSFFGSYESTWSLVGNELRLVRMMTGSRGVYPPERIAEVLVWLRAVGSDDVEFVSLVPSR
ncbi:MAG: DUF3857 domain-containing transglutaminase family protein [Gemmatimonadaceae bacterium]|nr:DUF3857 domain-containing transglutaminase family protein [Gemmatimonadaceae bacterium]